MNSALLRLVEDDLRASLTKASILYLAPKAQFIEILESSINKSLSSAQKTRAYKIAVTEATRLQDAYAKRDPISARAYAGYLGDDAFLVGSYAHANRQIKAKVREYLSSVRFLDSSTRIRGPLTTKSDEHMALALGANFTSEGFIEPGSINQISRLSSTTESIVNKDTLSLRFSYLINTYNEVPGLEGTFFKHFKPMAATLIDSTGIGEKVLDEVFDALRLKPSKGRSGKVSGRSVSQARGKANIRKTPIRNAARAQKNISTLDLINTINRRLPQTLKTNMTLPKLVWRTGRFANSVRVTSISEDNVIRYSYMKRPYGVFEMSSLGNPKWATPERDPRDLIDVSIRQIAASVTDQRFRTRRD